MRRPRRFVVLLCGESILLTDATWITFANLLRGRPRPVWLFTTIKAAARIVAGWPPEPTMAVVEVRS